MKLQIVQVDFPADLLAMLDPQEGDLIRELMARGEVALIATDDDGALVGYAVFGFDAGDMVTVYAARSRNNLMARAAMMGIFGAAQVIGRPVRVHTEKLRGMARMMGAQIALPARDGDGVPMGIFRNVI